jgi:hypothetical protein
LERAIRAGDPNRRRPSPSRQRDRPLQEALRLRRAAHVASESTGCRNGCNTVTSSLSYDGSNRDVQQQPHWPQHPPTTATQLELELRPCQVGLESTRNSANLPVNRSSWHDGINKNKASVRMNVTVTVCNCSESVAVAGINIQVAGPGPPYIRDHTESFCDKRAWAAAAGSEGQPGSHGASDAADRD